MGEAASVLGLTVMKLPISLCVIVINAPVSDSSSLINPPSPPSPPLQLRRALRHGPKMLNLAGRPMVLEPGGWASIDHVLLAMARNNYPINRTELDMIVRTCKKQRFGVSPDGMLFQKAK